MTSARIVMRERSDYGWVEFTLPFFESSFYICEVRRKNLGLFFFFLLRTHNYKPQSLGIFWTSNRLFAETSTWQHSQQTSKQPAGFKHATQASWPPLWSSGQSFWLQIQRSRVRFPALPDFLSSSGSGTGFTQPREVNWGATWIKK